MKSNKNGKKISPTKATKELYPENYKVLTKKMDITAKGKKTLHTCWQEKIITLNFQYY